MSEYLNSKEKKQRELKKVIDAINTGEDIETIKKDFSQLLSNVSAEEISELETALMKEGYSPLDIQALCEVHVAVFESALKEQKQPAQIPGHPLYSFLEENRAAETLLEEIDGILKNKQMNKAQKIGNLKESLQKLKEIELHYQRKENQLFPVLEQKGFDGPTKVMWGKHDEIRDLVKEAERFFAEKNLKEAVKSLKTLADKITKMMFMEEKILFPNALKKLSQKDWAGIKAGEQEIGYAWIKPGNVWDANIAGAKQSAGVIEEAGAVELDTGALTPEQINLLLKNLPADVTYVDANDKVRYYSQGADRIFPRSPAIIGRDVQNCHPPKSVHIVEKILQSFKKREKEHADFWINMNGRFILIQYFALYDEDGGYKGVIEVSQDATDIRSLQGEKRLLDR